MGEGSRKEKPRERRGIKLLAGTQEPIVRVPVVLEPVEVQLPLLAIPVEIRDLAVAVRVLPKMCKISSMPPLFECSRSCI